MLYVKNTLQSAEFDDLSLNLGALVQLERATGFPNIACAEAGLI